MRRRTQYLSVALVVLITGLACAGMAAGASASTRSARKQPDRVQVILTTANLRYALARRPSLEFSSKPTRLPTLHVDDAEREQTIIGFGAAMTDSSAWLLYDELPAPRRDAVMRALFSSVGGIALDLIRVPIGASDFTATGIPYSYDDVPIGDADTALSSFSIAHDDAYVLPVLQQMLSIAPATKVLSTEWSAPAWMKTNASLDDIAAAGELIPADYEALAGYFVKFIDAYQSAGIPIWAITPQNEPGAPTSYPGMNLTPAQEGEFVSADLVPALGAAGLHPLLFGGDQVAELSYGLSLMSSPAGPELSGMAWHCYGGDQVMTEFHALYPTTPEIMSECSPGVVPYSGAAGIVIDGLRNWASGIDLWNLALDPTGGPVQSPNAGCLGCTGLVTISEGNHSARWTQNYYELGQFSKFIEPGAVRLGTERWVSDYTDSDGTYGVTRGLDNVAVLNPDGSHAVVVYNNSWAPRRFAVAYHGGHFAYRLPPGATVTFRWSG